MGTKVIFVCVLAFFLSESAFCSDRLPGCLTHAWFDARRAKLRADVQSPEQVIKSAERLQLPAESITSIDDVLGTGGSCTVLKIHSAGMRLALKLYYNKGPSDYYLYALKQEAVAELGLAARVHGVFSLEETRKIVSRLASEPMMVTPEPSRFVKDLMDHLKHGRFTGGAILMEYLPGKRFHLSWPKVSVEWDGHDLFGSDPILYQELSRWRLDARSMVGRIGLVPSDEQVVVTETGEFKFFDLDFWNFSQ